MPNKYDQWAKDSLESRLLSTPDARMILADERVDVLRLLAAAGDVRVATFGRKVKVHQNPKCYPNVFFG